ncbi:hypothetical protein [Chitinophaga sp. XS-30]|uniref:baeRF3 domain-containing protein n=1 Tax=Chitinophaga sp. XS-30 TaxID=2604421 RepID=UPI0011DE22B0|nr:hypothetical protein [Chitinophaga sp. XS-30]QEH42273.1 hypothetical protein FW415_15910 [Chitinophaga sp. XS-30]
MIREQLLQLGQIQGDPCVTISLNTHRTHPDSLQDAIRIQQLCREADNRLLKEYGKRDIKKIREALETIPSEIDVNYNLDSLHVFISESTREIIRSPWPVNEDAVHIGQGFAVRPLIKAANRVAEYLVLLLSQSGVSLYEAMNDAITGEIRNDDFPFPSSPYYLTHHDEQSDARQVDNAVRQYFNKVDKAVVKVHHETQLKCIVICTGNNYSHLMMVADKPGIYEGHANINYNNTTPHHIVSQAWEIVRTRQKEQRAAAISEMKEAVSGGLVLTDLQEIYRAAKDGRGDLLIVRNEFSQPVKMTGERTFDIISDPSAESAVDDIASDVAWEVTSRNGRVVFTDQEEIKELGDIVLKTRY